MLDRVMFNLGKLAGSVLYVALFAIPIIIVVIAIKKSKK